MQKSLTIHLNGVDKTLDGLSAPATVANLVAALQFRAERVALELNGNIVSRPQWAETLVSNGDRVELVHFVGGGSPAALSFNQL